MGLFDINAITPVQARDLLAKDYAALDERTITVQEEEEEIPEPPQNNRPLVLVPGILGSELYRVDTVNYRGTPEKFRTQVWPPVGIFGIGEIRELAKLIRDRQLEEGTPTTLDAYNQLISIPMLEINPGPVTSNYYTRTIDETYFSGKWQFPPGQQLNVKRGLDFKKNLGDTIPGDNLLIACNDLDTTDEGQIRLMTNSLIRSRPHQLPSYSRA